MHRKILLFAFVLIGISLFLGCSATTVDSTTEIQNVLSSTQDNTTTTTTEENGWIAYIESKLDEFETLANNSTVFRFTRVIQYTTLDIDGIILSDETTEDFQFIYDSAREILMIYIDEVMMIAYSTDPISGEMTGYNMEDKTKETMGFSMQFLREFMGLRTFNELGFDSDIFTSVIESEDVVVAQVPFSEDTAFQSSIMGILTPFYDETDPYEGASLEYRFEFEESRIVITLSAEHIPSGNENEYYNISGIFTFDFSPDIVYDDSFLDSEEYTDMTNE